MNTPQRPKSVTTYYGPWRIPIRQSNVLCSDGRYRSVRFTTADNDTFFTRTGSVKVRGKTITGHVYNDMDGNPQFTAFQYRKNAHLLPPWITDEATNES